MTSSDMSRKSIGKIIAPKSNLIGESERERDWSDIWNWTDGWNAYRNVNVPEAATHRVDRKSRNAGQPYRCTARSDDE